MILSFNLKRQIFMSWIMKKDINNKKFPHLIKLIKNEGE